MEKVKNFKNLGESGYLNKNCWLVSNLGYPPYKRCQYCQLKFRNCLFLHYQLVSLTLLIIILILSILIEKKSSEFFILIIFASVVVYGYLFNKSTDKLIQANFEERRAKETVEELNKTLQIRVNAQTKELRRAYEELKVLDKAKSEFISMASHQLRTPLTAIKGYLSMFLEGSYGKLPERVKEKMMNIFQSSERLTGIINDLLSISRIELGKMELEKEPTQIEDLINCCCEELKIEAKKKNIKYYLIKPKKPLPKINIDKLKISQVFTNLIDNAIKYTRKGEIKVTLEKTDSSILVSVKDTGEGLTKEEIDSIFKGFVRGSAGNDYFVEGTGLGLYVAKKFLELHNGKIWAESEGKSKGSTFFVELPIK